jgi:copper(I)-binding protein
MKRTLLAAALAALSLGAWASVTVKDAWVQQTMPAQKATGAFMEITSDEDAAIVSTTSPVAGKVEILLLQREGGVVKMPATPRLALPAGKTVKLTLSGTQMILRDLRQPLKKGDTVPITLKVEGKNKRVKSVTVKAQVRNMAESN